MNTKTARDFPHHIVTAKTNHWEATDWCEKQLGKRWEVTGNREGVWCCFWRGRSVPGHYDWYFLNEQDALLFTLKWT